MAAERLGTSFEAVEVEMGDSNLPPAPVSGGSNSTASVCSAVMKACEAIREKLFRAAVTANDGPLTGLSPADLDIVDGRIVGGDRSEPVSEAIKRMGVGVIEEYAEFAPEGSSAEAVANLYKGKLEMQMGEKGPKVKYAFGAEFVEVRIHRLTREIRVPRLVGAFAAGRIMNPRTARSQLMGGMIWGVGCALHEATEIDRRTARYVNTDLQDYLVPVNADIDELQVILVEEEDRDVNPAGIKGLGELGNVGTPAAIASAVYHATGTRISATCRSGSNTCCDNAGNQGAAERERNGRGPNRAAALQSSGRHEEEIDSPSATLEGLMTRRLFCTCSTPETESTMSSARRFAIRLVTVPVRVTSRSATWTSISEASSIPSSVSRSLTSSSIRASERT